MMKRSFNRMTDDEKLSAFRVMLRNAASAVFLSGAGVSTESCIPDIRSKDGLYHKTEKRSSRYQPEYLLSYDCPRNEPDVFFDYYRSRLDARSVTPNAAHRVLARWEKGGKPVGVITQNIDGLHQKAGSVNVQQIHGTKGVLRTDAEFNQAGRLSYQIVADGQVVTRCVDVPQNYSLEVAQLGRCIASGEQPM